MKRHRGTGSCLVTKCRVDCGWFWIFECCEQNCMCTHVLNVFNVSHSLSLALCLSLRGLSLFLAPDTVLFALCFLLSDIEREIVHSIHTDF